MYDNLLRIYDEVTQKLIGDGDLTTKEIREILMKDLVETALAMDKTEVPEDVRDFLETWNYKDDLAIYNEADETSHAELSESEKMQKHAKEHGDQNGILYSLYDWLLSSAPKSFPPTIVYFGLCIYAQRLYNSQLCLAAALFGGELPDAPPHEHGEDEPDEDAEPDEDVDEEDTGDTPK